MIPGPAYTWVPAACFSFMAAHTLSNNLNSKPSNLHFFNLFPLSHSSLTHSLTLFSLLSFFFSLSHTRTQTYCLPHSLPHSLPLPLRAADRVGYIIWVVSPSLESCPAGFVVPSPKNTHRTVASLVSSCLACDLHT